ncbi:MAG: hypothetical protein SGPRY_014946, partial [Prymnesium sp.]
KRSTLRQQEAIEEAQRKLEGVPPVLSEEELQRLLSIPSASPDAPFKLTRRFSHRERRQLA